jgi:hypothetical protein
MTPGQDAPADAGRFVCGVESVFHQFWGGHYEVVKTFFSEPRPREQLTAWLELQLYKEIHVVPEIARKIIALYEKLDKEIERGEFESECYELADEAQHYRLLADVYETLTGQRKPALAFKPTPEQLALEAVRKKYRDSSPLTQSVGGFSPGGGTAFAAAGCMIDGGPIERQLAEAFKIIYRQEREHYNKNRLVFDRLAREADPADFAQALQYANELAREHFLLRNASFGYPLSAERVAAIERGDVTPYVPLQLY